MLKSLIRCRIIGVLVVAAGVVAACSTVRLSYNQGPNLMYWWLDGYVDVSEDQAPQVREAIGDWFRWHRSRELPEVLPLLQRAQTQAQEPTTPQAVCAWVSEGRRRVDTMLGRAVGPAVAFVGTLTPEQVNNIERKFRKSNDEFRDDFLQADPDERRKAAVKRVRERLEMLYGNLERPQREWLDRKIAASPGDPERWNAERRARQQDVLQTVRAAMASPNEAKALVAGLGERLQRSPRPEFRRYQDRVVEYNCALLAEFHNGATPAQREHARTRLKGWEDDVRALMGNGATAPSAAARKPAAG